MGLEVGMINLTKEQKHLWAKQILEDMLEWYDVDEKAVANAIEASLSDPSIKGKPLSEDAIESEWSKDESIALSWTAFCAGVRFAEKYHEIGDSNGN